MSSPVKSSVISACDVNTSTQAELTAREQYQYLQNAVDDWGADQEDHDDDLAPVEETPPSHRSAESARRSWRRSLSLVNKSSLIIKSALALVVAFALGWTPVQRFFATTSTEAVINAPLIAVRAPISGRISSDLAHLVVGAEVRAGQSIFMISNGRAAKGELYNLQREVGQLETTIMELKAKRDVLKSQHVEILSLRKQYKQGRVQALKKQIAAIDAQIDSAGAQWKEAQRILARAERLFNKGVSSQSELDKARRNVIVASKAAGQLKEEKGALEVARKFAEKGVFINDGYNDTPASVQRLFDLKVTLAQIEANIKGATQRLTYARRDLSDERERNSKMTAATVNVNISGRIWDFMVAPHEYVVAGQTLMHVLDCSNPHVTASVSKAVYQKLLIGQGATFKPINGRQNLKGWIAGLNGLAVVRTNEAIQPSLLSQAPYHVTLYFPRLRKQVGCRVGRSGSVDFDTGDRTNRAIVNINGAT